MPISMTDVLEDSVGRIGRKLKKARILEDGAELKLTRPWNGEDYLGDAYVELDIAGLYDERDTVLELELI